MRRVVRFRFKLTFDRYRKCRVRMNIASNAALDLVWGLSKMTGCTANVYLKYWKLLEPIHYQCASPL